MAIWRPRFASLITSHPSGTPIPSSTTARWSPEARRSSWTTTSPPRSANPCSTAFWSSSESTSASGVATSAGSSPAVPSSDMLTGWSGSVSPVVTMSMSRCATLSKATRWPESCERVSCTSAIEEIRRTDSDRASRTSGADSRRDCSRSREATVCRLFFTRWWISRIVASLYSSSRS